MKTRNLLITIGAVALTAITINLNAADALLSPRARDNQFKVVLTVASDRNLADENRNLTSTPRARDNQSKAVKGTESVDLAASKCNIVGSPKFATTAPCCKAGDVKHAECAITFACCAKM